MSVYHYVTESLHIPFALKNISISCKMQISCHVNLSYCYPWLWGQVQCCALDEKRTLAISTAMEALQEDKLMQPRVHHLDSFDSPEAANLNYRHKHPGE